MLLLYCYIGAAALHDNKAVIDTFLRYLATRVLRVCYLGVGWLLSGGGRALCRGSSLTPAAVALFGLVWAVAMHCVIEALVLPPRSLVSRGGDHAFCRGPW